MRAAGVLDRLARRREVTTLTREDVPARWADRGRRWLRFTTPAIAPSFSSIPWDWTHAPPAAIAAMHACHDRVERVHVFRLPMAPWSARFGGRCRRELDLDESESRTRRRIAALARRNGHHGLATALAAEAAFYERAEQEWLPRFDRVYTSSRCEAEEIRARLPDIDVRLLPNVVTLPHEPLRTRREGPFTLAFVGNLGYYPNHDAVSHLVRDIVPGWPARSHGDLRVLVAGGGASRNLRRLMARDNRVTHLGFVPDLTEVYRCADAAIVPLRAGGGTRIKILEALSWRVPVVATPEAVEGLDLSDGVQVLLGDSADALLHACMRLHGDAALAARLSAHGYDHVAQHHGHDALALLE